MFWHILKDVLLNSWLITSLVMVMMIMIEYVNVASAGRWFGRLQGSPLRQVMAGSLLGLIPGCIGGFAAVSLYSHGIISMGALVAAMISSSGDESFVMLAMIPRQALILFAVLFVLAVGCGLLTDLMFRKHPIRVSCDPGFELHEANKGEFPADIPPILLHRDAFGGVGEDSVDSRDPDLRSRSVHRHPGA